VRIILAGHHSGSRGRERSSVGGAPAPSQRDWQCERARGISAEHSWSQLHQAMYIRADLVKDVTWL
jgi:hypothetical protein